MEKRSSVRAPTSGPVRLHLGERTVEATIRDLGLEGVYVEVPPGPFRENDWIELSMSVPGSDQGAYRLRAVVTHRDERGIGLMFGDKDASLFRSIAAVLRNHRDGDDGATEAEVALPPYGAKLTPQAD